MIGRFSYRLCIIAALALCASVAVLMPSPAFAKGGFAAFMHEVKLHPPAADVRSFPAIRVINAVYYVKRLDWRTKYAEISGNTFFARRLYSQT